MNLWLELQMQTYKGTARLLPSETVSGNMPCKVRNSPPLAAQDRCIFHIISDVVPKYIFMHNVYAAGQTAAENEEEELDEDIAVTQSQTNFICPLTQVNASIISHHQVHKML